MSKSVSFNLSFTDPQAHYVNVAMHIDGFLNQDYIDIKMPVWAPGSYLIREYSKNVEQLIAYDQHHSSIDVYKVNKNTWRVYHHGRATVVNYSVYGFETSVRTNFINTDHAFLSPVATFMYVDKNLDLLTTVTIDLPEIWSKISTGLSWLGDGHTYQAENFDILYDSPIEIGNQDTWQFEVQGIIHECAMVGSANYDKMQLTNDIDKIIREENKIWGSNPNDYYLFITHHYENLSGGLEHLNSTVLATSRFAYNNSSTYKAYLSLVAHEYFHLWHVKRLRPKALGPFDYDQENYTTGLWIMEGVTSYYDNLILRRCGIYSEREYLNQLANEFNMVYNKPGFKFQSAAQSSFDTWIKQYRPDENSQNVAISYYSKGAMHTVAMDIYILANTKGLYRMDDVLRAAYNKFYLIENRGFEEAEFQELAQQVVGLDLTEFFDAANSTIDIDYNKYFHLVGYQLHDVSDEKDELSLGIKYSSNDGKIIIKSIERDSGAWVGGLNVDDELIAINNYQIELNGKSIHHVLRQCEECDKVDILVARDGLIKTIKVPLSYSTKKDFVIERLPILSKEQSELGKIWLSL